MVACSNLWQRWPTSCWDSYESRQSCQSSGNLDQVKIDLLWDPVHLKLIVDFLENCMSRFILSPKNYSVVLRSTQRIFRFVKKLKGCKKGCKLREFLFLVRNTLQRVPKIHCNYSLRVTLRNFKFLSESDSSQLQVLFPRLGIPRTLWKDSGRSNWRKKRARQCGEEQRAGCWSCWLLTKIGYCQD